MSEMKSDQGILDIIKSIASKRETGRLEIVSFGTRGVLLFNDGHLVDATLGSLNGFQAVNAAVSLRDAQFSFDHSIFTPRSSSIGPSERVVLRRFFGIEAAEMEEARKHVDPEIEWNMMPEQVVPLTEVEDIPVGDLQDAPPVELEPPIQPPAAVRSVVDREATLVKRKAEKSNLQNSINARKFAFLLRPRFAVYAALILALTAGTIALRSKLKGLQQATSVATTVESQSQPVTESPTLTKSAEQRDESERRDVNVQDLSGEWNVINTVQKTDYKSFDNMQVGFRLKINQTGKEFTARGEKFSENGRSLPPNNRTPIRVRGSIDGDRVVANFVEDGSQRKTNGRFVWKFRSSGLTGTFVSTAANSSGKSAATKHW